MSFLIGYIFFKPRNEYDLSRYLPACLNLSYSLYLHPTTYLSI